MYAFVLDLDLDQYVAGANFGLSSSFSFTAAVIQGIDYLEKNVANEVVNYGQDERHV